MMVLVFCLVSSFFICNPCSRSMLVVLYRLHQLLEGLLFNEIKIFYLIVKSLRCGVVFLYDLVIALVIICLFICLFTIMKQLTYLFSVDVMWFPNTNVGTNCQFLAAILLHCKPLCLVHLPCKICCHPFAYWLLKSFNVSWLIIGFRILCNLDNGVEPTMVRESLRIFGASHRFASLRMWRLLQFYLLSDFAQARLWLWISSMFCIEDIWWRRAFHVVPNAENLTSRRIQQIPN